MSLRRLRSKSPPGRDGGYKRQKTHHWNDEIVDLGRKLEQYADDEKYAAKMTLNFRIFLGYIREGHHHPQHIAIANVKAQILNLGQVSEDDQSLVLILKDLISELQRVSILSPSAFAKLNNWTEHQSGLNPHLCFQPASKSGLPVEILHPAFYLFKYLLSVPFPSNEDMGNAASAAQKLCMDMADGHANEDTLGWCFMMALNPLFSRSQWSSRFQCSVKSEATHTKLDGVFAPPKSRLLGQWKHAGGGDPYMQLAHSFWWFALRDEWGKPDEEHQRHGAPTILFLVQGITFMIAGGYYDGTSVMMEPLSPVQTMLLDRPGRVGNRIDSLAHHLYAAKVTHDYLQGYDSARDPTPLPGIPHPSIYSSIITYREQEYSLRFQELRRSDSLRLLPLLLWDGVLEPHDELPSIPVVIKLVYGEYAEKVHSCLGEQELAPRLYGIIHGKVPNHLQVGLSQPQDQTILPRAVVMERLHAPSYHQPGWITIHELIQDQSYQEVLGEEAQRKIFKSLAAVLDALRNEDLVHGDLRPVNIMIKLPTITEDVGSYISQNLFGDEVEVKVVDFDWGGDAGRVKYSLYRNDQGIEWPAKRGMPIECIHDSLMVKSWWAESFPDFDFTRFDSHFLTS